MEGGPVFEPKSGKWNLRGYRLKSVHILNVILIVGGLIDSMGNFSV
jgi:hypothetical protein